MAAVLGKALSLPFSPVISGALLVLLTNGPDTLREPLQRLMASDGATKKGIQVLKYLFGIGIALNVNNALSSWALANWQNPFRARKDKWTGHELAVVTGGSNGIGSFISKGLARSGHLVAIIDLVEPNAELRAVANIHFFKCDITDPEQVKQTADAIISQLGKPSILCNNAGIGHAHTILETTPQYLRKLFEVNLFSHFYLLQSFLPHMIEARKGHIITTCSMSSYLSPVGLVDYAASKAAVMAFDEGLRQEIKHRYGAPEIMTSCIHPTYVKTALVNSWEKELEKTKALVLTPEPVGNTIVKHILQRKGGRVFLPEWLGVGAGLRIFPLWLSDLVRDCRKSDMLPDLK
ncbi:estradiol 17-beta-dehydrogenase [Eremomyces bilateralis CBS 781.70]|uniref:Short-chain dehydrogenase/reductase 3 n=1 Tax=Eremomyces bilateralis CBS 781.70 TaxID=1392243 RepID=A0A6G1G7D8_9PEZI|nr:estradiol 17-beta-dehydrogenase [Eremomyces bilateralis CBS 781.70]KAF1813987.1 estradiol 17-beta-dehydrogenase [Eremomyces bilateralis CBS 781.70]